MNVTRYPKGPAYKQWYFLKNGNTIAVAVDHVKDKYKVDTVIKFHSEDFNLITKDSIKLTHFNIQYCGHVPGRRYLLIEMAIPGFFDGKVEKPPVLNCEHCLVAQCTAVRNNIGYDQLVADDFKHSLENIKDVDALKKAILRRYKKSLAHLSNAQKLSMGVSITELEIIKRF